MSRNIIKKESTDSVFDGMVIAHYEHKGHRFEIIVEPDAIDDLKQGKEVVLLNRMASNEVFKDARKGDRASEELMLEIFGTVDVEVVARQISLKGEVHLTTEQKKKMQEEKRKQIVAIIARNAMNPQTGAPHPPARIEAAMEEAKVHIDPFKTADSQVKEVLDALRPLMPIRFDKVRIAVKVSAENYGKVFGDIKGFGKVMNEEWQRDGSWIGVVEIPAGMQTDFLGKIAERTKGDFETKIVK